MRKYLKYILMGILAVTLSSIFFKKKTEAETSLPRDYAEIAASGILRAVTEYNSISFYADGDTVSGFHYELLHAFAHSKGLKPEITPEMSFSKRLEGVQKGTYDILANSTVVTTEYKDSLLFTRPIILNKQVLVQRKPEKENDSLYIHSQLELARKTLHLVKNSPAILRIHNLSNEIGDTIYIKEVEKYGQEQLLAMVAHGDIDYAVCDESIAQAYINDFPQLDIETAISLPQSHSWGASKHSPTLPDSLNSWLNDYVKTPAFKLLRKKYYNN